MKYRPLKDYTEKAFWIFTDDDGDGIDDNEYILIDGRLYDYGMNISPEVPDEYCCRLKIGRKYYYFDGDGLPGSYSIEKITISPENDIYITFGAFSYKTTHDENGRYTAVIDGHKYTFEIRLTAIFDHVLAEKVRGGYAVTIDGETVRAKKINSYDYSVSYNGNIYKISKFQLKDI